MPTDQPTGSNPDFTATNPRGFPAPQPGYPGPYGAPGPVQGRGRGGLVVAGLIGLVVGGLLASGAWLLFGGGGGGSSTPITAPERLGDYSKYGDAAERIDAERGKEVADRYRDWDRRSSERLSASYDGAGAFVQTYTDGEIEKTFTLEAVRAPSSALYAPYSDPEVLGLDRPTEEVREFGAVSCLIRNDPSQSYVTACLRTDDDLTIRVTRAGGDLLEDPEAVAALVDTAWNELS